MSRLASYRAVIFDFLVSLIFICTSLGPENHGGLDENARGMAQVYHERKEMLRRTEQIQVLDEFVSAGSEGNSRR